MKSLENKYITNYIYNTAIDGFDSEGEPILEGEEFVSSIAYDLLLDNIDIDIIVKFMDSMIPKSEMYLIEDFRTGMKNMLSDMKLSLEHIRSEDFYEKWGYEIKEGVYKDIE